MPRDFVFTAADGVQAFSYRGAYNVVGNGAGAIEVITGLPLSPEDLRRVLTGCPRISGSLDGLRFNDGSFQVRIGGDAGYVVHTQQNTGAPGWTIRAIEGPIPSTMNRWRAEFQRDSQGLPKAVHIVSTAWNGVTGEAFDLQLSFDQVRVNVTLPPETFTIERSPSAPTMDVDTLRESRQAPLISG